MESDTTYGLLLNEIDMSEGQTYPFFCFLYPSSRLKDAAACKVILSPYIDELEEIHSEKWMRGYRITYLHMS